MLGLFSVVTLFAHQYMARRARRSSVESGLVRQTQPTFSDALALVRKELWARSDFLQVAAEPTR